MLNSSRFTAHVGRYCLPTRADLFGEDNKSKYRVVVGLSTYVDSPYSEWRMKKGRIVLYSRMTTVEIAGSSSRHPQARRLSVRPIHHHRSQRIQQSLVVLPHKKTKTHRTVHQSAKYDVRFPVMVFSQKFASQEATIRSGRLKFAILRKKDVEVRCVIFLELLGVLFLWRQLSVVGWRRL